MRRGRLLVSLMVSFVIVSLLVGCATVPKYITTATIKGASCSQAQFAAGDIADALKEVSVGVVEENAEWVIRFADIDSSLGEQSYRIEVLGKVIEITGGDERGLMYGGLDLSEQIIIAGGIQGVRSSSVTPYIKERGFKYHTPLDLRCPCYPSIGDSGIDNIENVWDIEFWHEFIDTMAKDRFNTLYITNINPFASLVKVEDYPDCALDDVWAPTIPYDDSYKGSLEDAVREEHWQEGNYKVVKEMTIDEKIAFCQES